MSETLGDCRFGNGIYDQKTGCYDPVKGCPHLRLGPIGRGTINLCDLAEPNTMTPERDCVALPAVRAIQDTSHQ